MDGYGAERRRPPALCGCGVLCKRRCKDLGNLMYRGGNGIRWVIERMYNVCNEVYAEC